MSLTKEIIIGGHLDGERLDRVLQSVTGQSRKKAKTLLDGGQVFVNNRKVVIASWEIHQGDRLLIRKESEVPPPTADEYYLKVAHEDPSLIVVEKEAGINCERSAIATKPTMVAILNTYLKRKYPHLKHHYLGLVHRLDQETSGLMVYTKTKEANRITDQFKRHTIRRKYLTVVEGRIEGEGGRVDGYLQKSQTLSGGKKVKLSTPESGRAATTLFHVKERYAKATLVEIELNTGRTHQIRVHMASIGHPVVGDKIYGSANLRRKDPALPVRSGPGGGFGGDSREAAPRFQRQALHASFLEFHHPVSGTKMEFQSALPRDLRRLVDRLRIQS